MASTTRFAGTAPSSWRTDTKRPPWLEVSQRGALLVTVFLISAGYALVGLVLLLLTVLAEGVVRRRIPWRPGPLDVFLGWFIASFLISGWVSQFRPIAVGSAGIAALSIYLGFGPLYDLLRQDRRFLKTLLQAWVAGGIIAALWALDWHRVTGYAARTPELQQNSLATAILIVLFLDLGLFLTSERRWKYITAGGFGLLFLALALTTSRGAWLGGAIALITFFFLVGSRYGWKGILMTGIAAIVVVSVATSERMTWGIGILRLEKERSTFDRILLARSAEAMFLDHPLFGTGLNTYSLVYPKYRLAGDTNAAPPYVHNVFLNMAAEGGILGFAAFTAIMLWAAIAGWRWRVASKSRTELIMSATIFTAFLATLVHQMFDGTVISVHLGIALWFLVATLAAYRPVPNANGPAVIERA